ncbi:MAG: glycosyltransferase [Syntrophales bacterium]|nr:glycosyltransferase [Syntrophales bacterium]
MKFKEITPSISVIIPTHNRASLLQESLESLTHQTLPKDNFEVIVIDDGSTDCTKEICHQFSSILNLRYYFQEKSNIASAKNLGVLVSEAPITFFFDDDDVAHKNLLLEHIKTHDEYPDENIAVLGYTTWHPRLKITPVMRFITDIGQMLFAYSNLKHKQILDFTYFWGGRSSCKRSLLVKHGLHNQDFDTYQDIELGYRLSKHGFKVVYNAYAKSFMIREITFKAFCERCERKGRTLFLFSKLYPDDNIIQSYCQSQQAEAIWRQAQKNIESIDQKINVIETKLQIGNLSSEEKENVIKELYQLYWWTFHAHRIKGFVEAKRDYEKNKKNEDIIPEKEISREEYLYVKKKWKDHYTQVKKRLLVIDPFLPMFDRASGSLRLFQLLKIFKNMGYQVTFISIYPEFREYYVPILQQMGIEVYAGDPNFLHKNIPPPLMPDPNLEMLLKEREFEIVILDFWHTAKNYLPLIRKWSPTSKVIIDTVDIHFVRETRRAMSLKDENLMRQVNLMKKEEIDVYKQADRLWVVTEEDGKAIKNEVYPVPIDVIPNIHEAVHVVKKYENTSDLLFVGNFKHRPNVDGIIYFVKAIFPIISKALPDIKLYIVGNSPPEEVLSLSSKKIIVTGYVKDLSPYLEKARVFVAPLTYGAGMKGKIGEAMSWGIPVVTTTIGAEGMDLIHGEEALIADSPTDFAQNVISLYQNRDLWELISASGKRKVESLWSPEETERRVRNVFLLLNKPVEKRLTSIVILTLNGLSYTEKCIKSIFAHTKERFELIIVDNGSHDETCHYVRTLNKKLEEERLHTKNTENLSGWGKNCERIILIENKRNLGYAAGNNIGLANASGDYVVIINNDVVVTPNWLSKLIKAAEKSYRTGIVGPMTNQVTGPQLVASVDYDVIALRGLNSYAENFSEKFEGKVKPSWKAVGFCMLIKKDVINKIGGFDERFGLGNFEDDDFCLRAKLAGYDSLIAQDCFVHHFGGRTFTGEKIDYTKSLERNWEIFKGKWNLPPDLPFGTPYDVRMILNRPFSSDLHYVPIKLEEYTVEQGEKLFAAGDKEGAIFHLQKVLARDPSNTEAINDLGYIAFTENKTDEAISWFEQGLAIDPENMDILENISHLYVTQGDFNKAIAYLNIILKKRPDRVDILNILANCLVQTGALLEAENLYRQSYKLDNSQDHVREILKLFDELKKKEMEQRL